MNGVMRALGRWLWPSRALTIEDFRSEVLRLFLHDESIRGLAEGTGDRYLYVSLHTAPPIKSNQSSNEVSCEGYRRMRTRRSPEDWSIKDGAAVLIDPIVFPEATGGCAFVTHFAIGSEEAGAGPVLFAGELDGPFRMRENVCFTLERVMIFGAIPFACDIIG